MKSNKRDSSVLMHLGRQRKPHCRMKTLGTWKRFAQEVTHDRAIDKILAEEKIYDGVSYKCRNYSLKEIFAEGNIC